jgi:uncharacterized protein HemX
MLFLLQFEPGELIREFGPSAGAVILCAGLFIWNSIQNNNIGRQLEANTKAFDDNNTELVQAQRDLAKQLTEAVHEQAEMHAEQLSAIREIMAKQDVVVANQTTIMANFQHVVERLIDIVKEKT